MRVLSLSGEVSLEKEMATHSSIFAWRISWTEEPDGLQSMGSQSGKHLNDSHFHLDNVQKRFAITAFKMCKVAKGNKIID